VTIKMPPSVVSYQSSFCIARALAVKTIKESQCKNITHNCVMGNKGVIAL